jgi:hypothetical protein
MLHPDTILFNGNVITLNDRHPHASALAIHGDRVAFVGDDRAPGHNPNVHYTPHDRIDLSGRTVVPGFIDSHIHLLWFGDNLLRQADLVGAQDVEDVLARLGAVAARTTGWVRGHGFDQSKLAEGRFPTREELDRISRDRPVVISRVCGHAGVGNSAALGLLSDAERSSGDAGSGLFTEEALWAIYRHIPAPSEEEAEDAVLAAADVLLKTGITSVQTLLDAPDQMTAYTRLRRVGRLPIRVVGMPAWSAVEALHRHGVRSGFGDEWLRFGACKLFADGSLGAHTALLASPYADKPATQGQRIYEPEDLKRRVFEAQEKGWQVAIHAIGDQAVRETLDAIEHALDRDPARRDNRYHRHRIEHVSLCPPELVERMARRQVVGTYQPQFVTSDTWTPLRIGAERVPWAYPFRSLLHAGVPISLSSDSPVEWPSAFECLASAVGRHAWSPDEALTPAEAIRAYCAGSAYAGHVDHLVGVLAPGLLADLVILPADPTRLDAASIRSLLPEQVWLAGRRVR